MNIVMVKLWFLVSMYGTQPFVEGRYPSEEVCKSYITDERPMSCIESTYHLYEHELEKMEKEYGIIINKG